MKFPNKLPVLIIILLTFNGCSTRDDQSIDNQEVTNPEENNNPPQQSLPEIYAVGYTKHPNGNRQATFWKNGNMTLLTDGEYDAYATNVMTKASDIYIVGIEKNENGLFDGKIWKNGIEVSSYTVEDHNVYLQNIVIENNDIYAGGRTEYPPNWRNTPIVWKNDTPVSLGDGIWMLTSVNSITTKESVIYAAGRHKDRYSGAYYHAAFWKEGETIRLGERGYFSEVAEIIKANDEMYFVGIDANNGVSRCLIWKNAEEIELSRGDKFESVSSAIVENNDFYICGFHEESYRFYVAKYWKNDNLTILSDGTVSTKALNINIIENEVFVAGVATPDEETNIIKLWKNGTEVYSEQTEATINNMIILER